MSIPAIIGTMIRLHPLDRVPRSGYLLRGVTEPESVSAHSHSLALLTLLVCEEHPGDFDSRKAVEMALIHDTQEVVTMDIPLPAGNERFKEAKDDTEEEILATIFGGVSERLVSVYREFRRAESPEARLVRGLDKVQMMIKVYCYQREGRGNLEEFWAHGHNFAAYGLSVVKEMFSEIARIAGQQLP